MYRYRRLITIICLALILSTSVFVPAAAAPRAAAGITDNSESGIKVFINDLFYSLDTALDKDGMPMLPFRSIYELLGATVHWVEGGRTARGWRGSLVVDLHVESGVAVVNHEKVIIDIESKIVNDRTLVPAWFFGESLGADIDWDEEKQVINISLAPVRGISLEQREMTLEQGDTEMLIANVFPDDAVNKNIDWYSTQPSVADVHNTGDSSAVIAAVNPGTTIIIASTEEGEFVATCRVRVLQAYAPVTGIVLSHTEFTLVGGGSPQVISAQVLPETATNTDITWSSSNTNVATVLRHAVGRAIIIPEEVEEMGRSIISATTEEGDFVAVCIVTVLP